MRIGTFNCSGNGNKHLKQAARTEKLLLLTGPTASNSSHTLPKAWAIRDDSDYWSDSRRCRKARLLGMPFIIRHKERMASIAIWETLARSRGKWEGKPFTNNH